MNPRLDRLHPYPFERLGDLLADLRPPGALPLRDLSIGEPRDAPPEFVLNALHDQEAGFGAYPKTAGSETLREAIAAWLGRRFALNPAPDPATQVQPVNGTREALFGIAQCVAAGQPDALVALPNPGYQVYEGATLLSGAEPLYVPLRADNGYNPDFGVITETQWSRLKMVYLCSPGNPAGGVMNRTVLADIIERSDAYGFIVVSDECYSELYPPGSPPPGILQVCAELGRPDFTRCLAFHSLSKRSGLPGLRSGFVAGDAELIAAFRLYRSYQGCTMPPPLQAASAAAWRDETHVDRGRDRYQEKFRLARHILGDVPLPEGGFYLWLPVAENDRDITRRLYAEAGVRVMPGSFLGREVDGTNPGAGYLRLALVDDVATCADTLKRVATVTGRY